MRKRIVIIGIGLFIVFVLLFCTRKWMNARSFQVFGGLTSHVQTNEKIVALTFDDGPSEQTASIVALLGKYQAKATFFLIGSELEKNREAGQLITKAGHQIGNHTFSHQRMVFKKPSFIREEIEKTNQLIRETGYEGEIDFRPPNGKKLIGLPYYLHKQQIQTIMWSLEPDTNFRTPSDKVNEVVQHVKPGSIILLHPMYDKTELLAIEGILDALTKEGYTFVTVNDLQNR
ncbi:polysaccharide deacetylase family protein [Paenibacillus sp. CGMCC 1.16610]|uniref:Polysaccharide deacetylase family protein n=1 Tax=Paenibacillus anseongense TaxID=2682845 RepID=A0ABW9UBB9_9BACL|nr:MULTISPECIES: polysaccharide deacetylase family protein [Paenibacillus]MBA2938385.1 polysaccharide deacetylase family protein [Paenibacillus sp. CGMCC 1.16610]MVQ37444.1 polysaccharide deacetylase family protein [Paenibacillus anseongense]